MPHVDIYLSGRKYSVSCELGQEARLRELADHVGSRLRELADSGVIGSDAHMLALASLLIADQLLDTKEELERARRGQPKAPDAENAIAAVDAITRRVEELAARVEQA